MQIYNVGNTNPHTVTEMVDLLERFLQRPAKRWHVPVPPTGDVLATFADISAAEKVTHRHLHPYTFVSQKIFLCPLGAYEALRSS